MAKEKEDAPELTAAEKEAAAGIKLHNDQLEKMLNPETDFVAGDEVTLPDGSIGKVIEVKDGGAYSVKHSATSDFKAAQLKKA